ncbi:MAG TPA: NUDIX hydrolase [Candidatus Saccharimonadales bacterium]|nr:NUDIX hydrolase [Candidatus Saccharimonadales bacterium]
MHHIQRKILNKLLYAMTLPYAAMRPEGIESNHYAYHLEQLLTAGLIVKQDKQYCLTAAGLQAVDRMSQEQMTPRLQPHIVTAVDITNSQGQTLLFKRAFQPYIHRLGFPLGKTHYAETVAQAATRELLEKTGLGDVPLTQRGIVYVESRQDGVTISKILCHVFQGAVDGTPDVGPNDVHRGECLWLDAVTLTDKDVMPGFLAIKQLLAEHDSKNLFFAELAEDL